MNKALVEIVKNFISLKKEGYWDFKEKYCENNTLLIYRILCLANCIQHHGPRYLIFGITDPSLGCEIVGVKSDPNRKTQASLIDLLSKVPFSGDLRPDVSLETIPLNGFEVDVIVIEDLPFKPFVVSETYPGEVTTSKNSFKKEMVLNAGTVYTRVGDKNTAKKNKTADLYHVEQMWRQRFGLDRTPTDRLKQYMFDFINWKSDGVKKSYYIPAPEFTFEYILKEDEKSQNRWWSKFHGETTMLSEVVFKYHLTILEKLTICRFHREDILIPYPNVVYPRIDPTKENSPENTYCLFFFIEDSLNFAFICNVYGHYKTNLSAQINRKRMMQKKAISSPSKFAKKHLPFIVFKNLDEKEAFLKHIEESIKLFFIEENITPKKELGDSKLEEEKLFAYWAYERYFSVFMPKTQK
jgi:hypothetical protein